MFPATVGTAMTAHQSKSQRFDIKPQPDYANTALSYMLTGIFAGLLIGLGLRKLTGLEWAVAPGLLVGVALSWYMIWIRYVRVSPSSMDATEEQE